MQRRMRAPLERHALDEERGGIAGGCGRIRCPLCAWEPRADDRWFCCTGQGWNTFETRGRCPHCHVQWRETQCLACGRFSLHERWYVDPGPRT